jgi:hypothetical protein
MHYVTSISRAMKANGGDYELDDDDDDDDDDGDDDDDYEELSEPEEAANERVRIWLDSSMSSREIKPLDLTAEDKGNIEMLGDRQRVVSI